MLLLLLVLRCEGARAEHVRQLLLESASFERGLTSMVDTWQDVLRCGEDVSADAGHLRSTCMVPAWHLLDTCGHTCLDGWMYSNLEVVARFHGCVKCLNAASNRMCRVELVLCHLDCKRSGCLLGTLLLSSAATRPYAAKDHPAGPQDRMLLLCAAA
jgi:hypothetical protein